MQGQRFYSNWHAVIKVCTTMTSNCSNTAVNINEICGKNKFRVYINDSIDATLSHRRTFVLMPNKINIGLIIVVSIENYAYIIIYSITLVAWNVRWNFSHYLLVPITIYTYPIFIKVSRCLCINRVLTIKFRNISLFTLSSFYRAEETHYTTPYYTVSHHTVTQHNTTHHKTSSEPNTT